MGRVFVECDEVSTRNYRVRHLTNAELLNWDWGCLVFHGGLFCGWIGPAGRAAYLDSFHDVVNRLLTYSVGGTFTPSRP